MIIFATHRYPSAITRGRQIAEKLGCSLNVEYEKIPDNETLVFVKGFCYEPKRLIKEKNCKVFLDVIDSDVQLSYLWNNPEIGVIAISNIAHSFLRARLPFTRKIVTIDEHHCNFLNEKRQRDKVEVVGYVGSKFRLDYEVYDIRKMLEKVGLEFKHLFVEDLSRTREEIVEFYKGIDIQLCISIPRMIPNMPPELKNPLKIANASSFGIPTVGFPELCWCTEDGCWVPSLDLASAVSVCKMLKESPETYNTIANNCISKSQKYSIDTIIERYKELEK
jgi:hypothetical protein